MEKLAVIIIILLIPCIVVAEQDAFSVEGEWYIDLLYTNMCFPAVATEDGYFCVSEDGGDSQYKPDGVIENPDGSITTDFKRFFLSDDAVLYYSIHENEIYGSLFVRTDGVWKLYYVGPTVMTLFIDGSMIPYNGGDRRSYMVENNMMFITNDDSYIRGKIRRLGSNAFVINIDAEPYIVNFSNFSRNCGSPFYFCVSTFIAE